MKCIKSIFSVAFIALLPALLFAQNSFTDSRDGKAYKTAKIGARTWMAENLNYDANGSKCYNDEAKNCQKYGRLYDFSTAEKACPAGWHLPTAKEFDMLRFYKYKEGDWNGNYGKRLKAKNGWNGTDDFGFSALPAGVYSFAEKIFVDIDSYAYFWTSTKSNSDSSWRIFFAPENNESNIGIDPRPNKNLLSIRCVKDDSNTAAEKSERDAEEIEFQRTSKNVQVEMAKLEEKKCAQMPNNPTGAPFLSGGRDGVCSKEYFEALVNKGDVNKLKEDIQKTICLFIDKPNFNSKAFIRSCFSIGEGGGRDPIDAQIYKGNAGMVDYLISATSTLYDFYMSHAIEVLGNNKTAKAAEMVKLLQKYGAKIDLSGLHKFITNGDLEAIKFMHEQGINLQGDCKPYSGPCFKSGGCSSNCSNPIDLAKENSKKIYQYLSGQGYKTLDELTREQGMARRETEMKELEEAKKQIENAIKANKLEEAVAICSDNVKNYYPKASGNYNYMAEGNEIDKMLGICLKDLVNKVRKLPLNKINSEGLATIYFSQAGYHEVRGTVIQNDGKMALLSSLGFNEIFMLQHSGKCTTLRQGRLFSGYAKSLGNKTYTTVTGARQSVPNYQLLYCGE